jgi:hypothetical protein
MIDEYQVINISQEPAPDQHGLRKATIETSANRWARLGWETVSVMPSQGPGYADAILIKRRRLPLGIRVTDRNGEYYVPMEDVAFIYPKEDD